MLLEIKQLNYSHPGNPNLFLFKQLDFAIATGEHAVIVGDSGGGKSTTVGLIERFYDPTGGVVEFRGQDIRSLHPAWYRDQIGKTVTLVTKLLKVN